MFQLETDSATAAKAASALTLLKIPFSIHNTAGGTAVIAVPTDHVDKLRELVGQEEPKDYLVFFAIKEGGLPVAIRIRARSTEQAVIGANSKWGEDCRLWTDKTPGHVGYDVSTGGSDEDEFKHILTRLFVVVLRLPTFEVELRNDPIAGKCSRPGEPFADAWAHADGATIDSSTPEMTQWERDIKLHSTHADWKPGSVEMWNRHVEQERKRREEAQEERKRWEDAQAAVKPDEVSVSESSPT